MAEGSDYYANPSSRTGLEAAESFPARVIDADDGARSARWGVNNRQRVQRVMLWNPEGAASALAEVQLNHTPKQP